MSETELTINRVGFPPFSARGCIQSLSPLFLGGLKRTVNGNLINLERPGAQKYRSTIRCRDKATPAMDGVWQGSKVKVGCLAQLTQWVEGGQEKALLKRPPVEGSVVAFTQEGEAVEIASQKGSEISFSLHEGAMLPNIFVSYRPLLDMYVTDFQMEADEWGMAAGWALFLEEA